MNQAINNNIIMKLFIHYQKSLKNVSSQIIQIKFKENNIGFEHIVIEISEI